MPYFHINIKNKIMPGKSKEGGGLQIEKYAFKMEDPNKKYQQLQKLFPNATSKDTIIAGRSMDSNMAKRMQNMNAMNAAASLNNATSGRVSNIYKAKKEEKNFYDNKNKQHINAAVYNKQELKNSFKMEDLSGDGKVTQKDVLIGKGVLNKDGSKANAMKPKGYQMNYKMVNREGLKMAGNPAYKYHEDGHEEFEVGDFGNLGNEYKQISAINTEPIYGTSISKYTGPLMPDEQWAALSPEKKRSMNAAVGADEKGDITKDILSGFNTIISTSSIPQPGAPEVKGDAFSNFDARQRERRVMTDTRKSKRAAIKEARAQANVDGLKGEAKREYIKEKKNQAKLDQAQNKKARLGVLSDQIKKQESQAVNPSVGKKGRVIVQEGTPGSSTTDAKLEAIKFKDFVSGKKSGNVKFAMKPMQLSHKAMNYFNKKNKK